MLFKKIKLSQYVNPSKYFSQLFKPFAIEANKKKIVGLSKRKEKILLKSKSAYKHLEQKPMTRCWQTTDIRIK